MAFIVYTNDKGDVTNNYVITKLNHKMQYNNYIVKLSHIPSSICYTINLVYTGSSAN